jgi:hypothetical protein
MNMLQKDLHGNNRKENFINKNSENSRKESHQKNNLSKKNLLLL